MKHNEYVIQSGDTLSEIASRFYGKSEYASALARANNIYNKDRIIAGLKLRLPAYIFTSSESKDHITLSHIVKNSDKKTPLLNKKTGPGKFEYQKSSKEVWLYNFDIDSAELKDEHKKFLDEEIAPSIRNGNSLGIFGMASRTGSTIHNEELSKKRMQNIYEYLISCVNDTFEKRVHLEWFGERIALQHKLEDDVENERYRSVALLPTSFLKPVNISKVNINQFLNKTDLKSDKVFTGDLADKISIGIDIVGMLPDIIERLPWAKVAASAEPLALAQLVISAVASLPLTWWSVENQNNFNGRIEGICEAMQDMSNEYFDNTLDKKPLYLWPPFRHPEVHPIQQSHKTSNFNDNQYMNGKKEGVEIAFKTMLTVDHKYVILNGITFTGKELLRAFKLKYGDRVGDEFKKAFNKIMVDKGMGTFPIIK